MSFTCNCWLAPAAVFSASPAHTSACSARWRLFCWQFLLAAFPCWLLLVPCPCGRNLGFWFELRLAVRAGRVLFLRIFCWQFLLAPFPCSQWSPQSRIQRSFSALDSANPIANIASWKRSDQRRPLDLSPCEALRTSSACPHRSPNSVPARMQTFSLVRVRGARSLCPFPMTLSH